MIYNIYNHISTYIHLSYYRLRARDYSRNQFPEVMKSFSSDLVAQTVRSSLEMEVRGSNPSRGL